MVVGKKCEDCRTKAANFGLPPDQPGGGRVRWCSGCAKQRGQGATNLKNRKCEDCLDKQASFGLPGERKKRWCSTCAKAGHPGAVSGCPPPPPRTTLNSLFLFWFQTIPDLSNAVKVRSALKVGGVCTVGKHPVNGQVPGRPVRGLQLEVASDHGDARRGRRALVQAVRPESRRRSAGGAGTPQMQVKPPP